MITAPIDQPQHVLKTLTDFGDSAVLLPLSVVLFVWLLATRPAAAAFAWLLALVVCNTIIGLLKLYFFACPVGLVLHSPSGHTGFGVLVYGSLTAILALEARSRWGRIAIVVLGAGLLGGIAISRLMLQMHTPLEITIGAVIGLSSLAFFIRVYRGNRGEGGRILALGLSVIVVSSVFYGGETHAEAFLQSLSSMLGVRHLACEYRPA